MSAETLNLLPPQRRSMIRLHRRLHVWMLLAVVYSIGTLGACIALAAGEPVVDRHEALELTVLTRETDALKEETSRHRKEIAEQNRVKQGADLVRNHPDWSILLDLLAATRGEDVVVEGLDVKPLDVVKTSTTPGADQPKPDAGGKAIGKPAHPSAFDVRLTGFARTQTSVTEFADRLQKSDVFDLVTLERSSAKASRSLSVIEFTILCHLGTTAGPSPEPIDKGGKP